MANYPIANRFDKMANPDTNTTGDYVLDGLNTFYPEFMQSENAQDFSGKNCNILDDVLYITKNSNCIVTGEGDADVDQVKLINFDCHNGNHINLLAGRGKKITLIESIPQLVLGIESMELSETDPVRFQKVAGNWYYRGLLPTTETQVGLARKATVEEVNSGTTDSEKGVSFVTPESLENSFYGTSLPRTDTNYINNMDFILWCRGVNFTTNPPVLPFYLNACDCWGIIHCSPGTPSAHFLRGFLSIDEYLALGMQWHTYARLEARAGNGNDCTILTQRVEDASRFLGRTLTFSFWARHVSGDPTLRFIRNFTVPSFGTDDYAMELITLTPEWKKYSITFTCKSKLIVNNQAWNLTALSNSYLALALYADEPANSMWQPPLPHLNRAFDISHVQLEEGTETKEHRTRTYVEEQDRCARYVQTYTGTIPSFKHVDTQSTVCYYLKKEMRVVPSCTFTIESGANPTPGLGITQGADIYLMNIGQPFTMNYLRLEAAL